MALDTNTKKTRSSFDKLMDLYWGGAERRISALTIRIIGINIFSVIILMLGVINLGRYEAQILNAKLEGFQKETVIIAKTIASSPLENNTYLENLKAITSYEIKIFSTNGNIINQTTQISINLQDETPLSNIKKWAQIILPNQQALPIYHNTNDITPEIANALEGNINIAAWQTEKDRKDILISSAAPLIKDNTIIGAVHILRHSNDIVEDINRFWDEMLQIFLITLLATIFISIYLSGTIARPLKQLAKAAETIRRTKSPNHTIPDLSDRLDEIGELSLVMRDMTETMWNRIDTIDRFAADVAHELKNPLTSLKSAVETLRISKKKKDKETLLTLLQNDIERMDRLISDISAATKLDAQLSRESLERLNITKTLGQIIDRHHRHTAQNIQILFKKPNEPLWVYGLNDHLIQVFDNIIMNALSFSKNNDTITITIEKNTKTITITIEDQGPGIPENKLETIFERFYSERPEHEDYGKHSGLGLSICKQVITALGGNIHAENRENQNGARFIITLNAVQ